jgi:ABC-type cobalamin/Fe3+-siderophores transport system ATPase subunit
MVQFRSDADKARWLDGVCWIDARLPEVRAAAAEITRGCSDPYERGAAIVRWVRDHVTYTPDTWETGQLGERIADAAVLLGERAEDCDGKARAVVALGRLPHQRSVVDEDAIQDAMVRCDIADLAERPVNELSGGERARVLLARALATGGKVILADEPFAQLDPQHQIHAMEVLKAEAGRGAAVIVVLHDLALAARYCDRVVVFSAGKIAAQGLPRDVLSSDILRNVFGVDAFIGEHQGAPLVLPIRRRSESAASRGSSPHQG